MKKLITISLLSALALGGVALAQGPGHHGHGRMLEQLDTNKDGKLTRAEVQSGATARFNKLDTNKDGVVDAKELAAELNERFETMDVNGDNVVDAEERAKGFGHGGHCGGPRGEHGEHGEHGHDRG